MAFLIWITFTQTKILLLEGLLCVVFKYYNIFVNDKQTNKQTNKKTQKNLVFSQLTDTQAGGNLTISHNFLKLKNTQKEDEP